MFDEIEWLDYIAWLDELEIEYVNLELQEIADEQRELELA